MRGSLTLPEWFDLRRYGEAETLEPPDWYLNLKFRGWLARSPNEVGEGLVRNWPVLRLSNEEHRCKLHLLAETLTRAHEPAPLAFVHDLLRNPPRAPSGVSPVHVWEMYAFERRLPQELRDFARIEPQRERRQPDDPKAYFHRLDHAFSPQYTGRFIRVDLNLPDDVLLEDLGAFLKAERADLAKHSPKYIEVIRKLKKLKEIDLTTLANVRLLPYLDLMRWLDANPRKRTRRRVTGLPRNWISSPPCFAGHATTQRSPLTILC